MQSGISPWSILLLLVILTPIFFFIYAYINREKSFNPYSTIERHSRLEFLGYFITILIISFAAAVLSETLSSPLLFLFTMIFSTAAFLYITAKRLHDFSMSGLWSLLVLFPFSGLLIFIICLFSPPMGNNQSI